VTPPKEPTKVESALADANAILAQFIPLVGLIGTSSRAVIALLRAHGKVGEAEAFEAELAAAEASRAKLGDAIADFHRKYDAGRTEPPAQE
jgi:hypothetical protein